jgi:hypothetical protein
MVFVSWEKPSLLETYIPSVSFFTCHQLFYFKNKIN